MTMFEKRPNALLKFFFKMPLFMHKIGLGGWERLLGAQWMFITTIGRKTGKRREAMVDVMDYDKRWGRYRIRLQPSDFEKNRKILGEIISEAYADDTKE